MIQSNKQSSHKKQSNKSSQIKSNPSNNSNYKSTYDNEYQKQNRRVFHNKSSTMPITKVLPTIRQNQTVEKIKRQSQDVSIFKKYFNQSKNVNALVNTHSSNVQSNYGAYSGESYLKNNIYTGDKQKNTIRFSNILAETQKQHNQLSKQQHQNHSLLELKNSNNQIQISEFIPEQPHSFHPDPSAYLQDERSESNNPNLFQNITRIISCKKQTQSLISQLQFYIGIIDKFKKENKYYRNLLAERDRQNKQLRDVIHDRDLEIIQIKQDRDRFARLYTIQGAKVCVLKDSCREVIETKWGDFMQERLYRQSLSGQQEFQTENESQYEQKQKKPKQIKSIEKNPKRMYQTSQSPSVSLTNKKRMHRNENDVSFYTNNSNYSHLLYDNIHQSSYEHFRPSEMNKSHARSINPENEHRRNNYNNKNQSSINISRLLNQKKIPKANLPASNRKSGKIIKSKQLQNSPLSNLYQQNSNISRQQHEYHEYEQEEILNGMNNQNYHQEYQKFDNSTYLQH